MIDLKDKATKLRFLIGYEETQVRYSKEPTCEIKCSTKKLALRFKI